ncbi:hypothetical protein ABTF01_22220, partial [Acinetobacter baumannii]
KTATLEKRSLLPVESDQIVKLSNSIQAIGKKYNLSNYHGVLKECLMWMNESDNEKAKLFHPIMLEFLKHKSNELKNAS